MNIYAIIPVAKIKLYVSEDTQFGRFSLDKKYLIWDRAWPADILEKMRSDSEVRLLTQNEALAEIEKDDWTNSSDVLY